MDKKTRKCIKKSKIAIIIPFRDNTTDNIRHKQLQEFIKHMNSFFRKSDYYKIFVIEQSDDNRKFNRGKLLNIGFQLTKELGFNIFIFHDVDLLPSKNLLPFYTTLIHSPIHIARVWNRYSSNPSYFGGVVAFNSKDFEKINGFPNNFWGWGGEDDELFLRTKTNKLNILFPSAGSFTDLENMNIDEKVAFLKKNQHIKNMRKYELLDPNYRNKTWKKNGLNSLQYTLLQEIDLSPNTIKFTVKL